jgi:hypothetical protein
MQLVGANPTTIRLRAWADGQPEPGTWPYVATDSTAALQGSGAVGLLARLSSSATGPLNVSYDGFRAVAP